MEGIFSNTKKKIDGTDGLFSPFTFALAENNIMDQDMDCHDNFFAKYSLTDSDKLKKEQFHGDRFIAKRRLDFESALNFEKKSLILK